MYKSYQYGLSMQAVMQRVGEHYEYSNSLLLGHGAFALVFKGHRIKVMSGIVNSL